MAVAPKGIKISALDSWSGDTTMKLHVHKDGASESISIKQIVDLSDADECGGSGSVFPGELVQRVSGSYADAVPADGAELLIADNQALYDALQLRQNDTTKYYALDTPARFYLSGVSADDKILDVCVFDDKIFAVSESAADKTIGTFGVYSLAGVRIAGMTIKLDASFKFYTLLQSQTTVYIGATVAGAEALYAWNGLALIKILDGYSWQFTKIGGYSAAQDILVYYNQRIVINTADLSVALPLTTWKTWESFACSYDTNRIFALGTDMAFAGEGVGVYEVKGLNTTNPSYVRMPDLSPKIVQSGNLVSGFTSDLYVISGGTTGKVILRYDTLNNIVYQVPASSDGYNLGVAYKNTLALWRKSDADTPTPVLSYDRGVTFAAAPVFNSYQVPKFGDEYFVQAGAPGSIGSSSSGHLQLSGLKMISPDTFFVPKLASVLPGYSYFLRK